jgi:hypothetical protein
MKTKELCKRITNYELRITNYELRIISIIFLICVFNAGNFSQTNPTAPASSNPRDYKILGGTVADPHADPSYINVGGVNAGGIGGSINFQAGSGMNATGSMTFSLASSSTTTNGNINFLIPYGLIKIGTSTSSLPLTISGSGNLATSGAITAGSISTSGTITVSNYINSTGNMLLKTGGTTRLTIGLTDGQVAVSNNLSVFGATILYDKVSIGASTQRAGCILTVNGKIAAEEFEIMTDVAVPDYVFGKYYKLRSLKELEDYIKTHNHLPEVPSAGEVKQNGYKVAEMNNTLLKKVEELTLYVIELNKQLEATKTELAKMKEGR